MDTRTIYLISARNTAFQRAHFSIFVPSITSEKGTKIHAVGAPMAGYVLEFKRNYNPSMESHDQLFPIGQIHSSHIIDAPLDAPPSIDSTPRGNIELAAAQIPAPGISQNFIAPVNDISNKRCQEWTMEYVRHLVAKGIVGEKAIGIVQSKRDPPSHGIGLRPVAR